MPAFASPHPRYQESFLSAVGEILDAGEGERLTGLTVFGEETHTVADGVDTVVREHANHRRVVGRDLASRAEQG